MVSQETLTSCDLADIESVQFKCKCGAALSLNPDGPLQHDRKREPPIIPERCPQCSQIWFPDDRDVVQFLNVLKELRRQKGDMTIRLIIPFRAIAENGK